MPNLYGYSKISLDSAVIIAAKNINMLDQTGFQNRITIQELKLIGLNCYKVQNQKNLFKTIIRYYHVGEGIWKFPQQNAEFVFIPFKPY